MADYIIPIIICAAGALLMLDRRGLFDDFVEGAREGLMVVLRLLPTLVALLVCVGMFSASGALDFICAGLDPFTRMLGIPGELLPLVIMRPISGSGSLALASDLFGKAGADSFAGMAGSILVGSSDTLFYIFAVYFSAAGVKRTGPAMAIGLFVQVAAVVLACMLAGVFM